MNLDGDPQHALVLVSAVSPPPAPPRLIDSAAASESQSPLAGSAPLASRETVVAQYQVMLSY
ncbi:hypothetical protein HDU82_003234, partial [Entophlyctis luteolus]